MDTTQHTRKSGRPLKICRSFKLTTVGESGVGKTSIMQYLVRGKFVIGDSSTIGAAFMTFKYPPGTEEPDCKFEIWDTAGQERFFSLVELYIRNSHVIVVVYDGTSLDSLNFTKTRWIPHVKKLIDGQTTQPILVLVENKTDLMKDEHKNITEMGMALAAEHDMMFFRTSPFKGDGIAEMFAKIAGSAMKTEYVPHKNLMSSIAPRVDLQNTLTEKKDDRYKCFGVSLPESQCVVM